MTVRKLEAAKQENKKLDDVRSLTDYLGREIVVWDVEFKTTKYGPAAYLTVSEDEKSDKFIVLTHSSVVLGQLDRFQKENELPLQMTLTKVERYYMFL